MGARKPQSYTNHRVLIYSKGPVIKLKSRTQSTKSKWCSIESSPENRDCNINVVKYNVLVTFQT